MLTARIGTANWQIGRLGVPEREEEDDDDVMDRVNPDYQLRGASERKIEIGSGDDTTNDGEDEIVVNTIVGDEVGKQTLGSGQRHISMMTRKRKRKSWKRKLRKGNPRKMMIMMMMW